MSGPIYCVERTISPTDRAARIQQLAKLGVAGCDTGMNVDLTDGAFCELFEVIGEIANELVLQLDGIEFTPGQARQPA